jgi:CheY-like chemotaxis protein
LDQTVPIVLVIEDDDSIQTVVEDALSDAGFEPAIAPSGEEAVTLLKGMKNTYRALVTDITLRGKIDGWEVAQQARQIDRLYQREERGGVAIKGRPQQHHVAQAVRAGTTRDRNRQSSEPLYADNVEAVPVGEASAGAGASATATSITLRRSAASAIFRKARIKLRPSTTRGSG